MTRGLYDTFPGSPGTFPGHIRWFPGPFLMKILIFLQRLVHKFTGSVKFFLCLVNFPGSQNRFPGPPGPPDTFPVHFGPCPGLLLMEILIFYPPDH